MLYEAVFWGLNPNKPSFEDRLADPSVNNALVDWGARAGDTAVIALVDSIPAGAAWYRFYSDDNAIRRHINETIPAIVIAVHEHYRRQGMGEKMVEWFLDHATKHHIQELSLMVSRDNHALKLYQKCGFQEYADKGDSWLMLRKTATEKSGPTPRNADLANTVREGAAKMPCQRVVSRNHRAGYTPVSCQKMYEWVLTKADDTIGI